MSREGTGQVRVSGQGLIIVAFRAVRLGHRVAAIVEGDGVATVVEPKKPSAGCLHNRTTKVAGRRATPEDHHSLTGSDNGASGKRVPQSHGVTNFEPADVDGRAADVDQFDEFILRCIDGAVCVGVSRGGVGVRMNFIDHKTRCRQQSLGLHRLDSVLRLTTLRFAFPGQSAAMKDVADQRLKTVSS